MTFAVLFQSAARRELLALPKRARERIFARLDELARDPCKPGTEAL